MAGEVLPRPSLDCKTRGSEDTCDGSSAPHQEGNRRRASSADTYHNDLAVPESNGAGLSPRPHVPSLDIKPALKPRPNPLQVPPATRPATEDGTCAGEGTPGTDAGEKRKRKKDKQDEKERKRKEKEEKEKLKRDKKEEKERLKREKKETGAQSSPLLQPRRNTDLTDTRKLWKKSSTGKREHHHSPHSEADDSTGMVAARSAELNKFNAMRELGNETMQFIQKRKSSAGTDSDEGSSPPPPR